MRWRKNNPPTHEPERVEHGSVMQAITRFWVTLFILAAIIYVTLLVVGRSAGFKDLVQNGLEPFFGMPVLIDRVHVRPDLKLAIEGLRDEKSRVRIDQAQARVGLIALVRRSNWPFRSLNVDGASLQFFPAADGRWQPLPDLADALLPWMSADTNRLNQSSIPEWLRLSGARLALSNVSLRWMADETNTLNTVEGLSLKTATVRPFDEDIFWAVLKISSARAGGTAWLRDLEVEWLRMPGQDVVLRIAQSSAEQPLTVTTPEVPVP